MTASSAWRPNKKQSGSACRILNGVARRSNGARAGVGYRYSDRR